MKQCKKYQYNEFRFNDCNSCKDMNDILKDDAMQHISTA